MPTETERSGRDRRTRPRVLYYCLPSYLEHVPMEVAALAPRTDLHVLFEVPARTWEANPLGIPLPDSLTPGVSDFAPHLKAALPAGAWDYFAAVASVKAAVFPPGLSMQGLRVARSVAKAVRTLSPDVIHFDGESARGALWLLATGIPVVANIHEPTVVSPRHMPELVPAKKYVIHRANRIIVHSDEARREISRLYPRAAGKCVLARMGAMTVYRTWLDEPAARHSASCHDDRLVLFFGRLTPRKGVEVFMAAAQALSARLGGVRFVVAGPPDLGYSPPQSRDLNGGCVLDVRPRRHTPRELAALMAGADVVVLPYRDARQSSVVLTAYAFGVPVIASDIPAMREQVESDVTGLLVPAGDAHALAATIGRVLQEQRLLGRLRDGTRQYVLDRGDWTTFVEASCQAYETVMGMGSV